jgi:hypothetical protein
MPRPPKRNFPGILARPMVWKFLPPADVPVLGATLSDEERRVMQRDNQDQFALRLAALFEHYEIGPAVADPWRALAVSLALDFVPGFEIRSIARRERGATKKWDGFRAARLLADVASLMKRGSKGKNACRLLTELPRYAARYGHEKPDSLYRRYKEAKGIVRAGGLDWLVQVFRTQGE